MRFGKNIITALIIVGAVLLMTSCGGEKTEKADYGNFGHFEGNTVDGRTVNQEIFTGAELTMVKVWATYCGYCIDEMADEKAIAEAFKGRSFQILGVVTDVSESDVSVAEKILKDNQVEYPNLIFNRQMQAGILGSVQALPTTIFVDKQGNVVGDPVVGARDKESWTEIIEERLQEVNHE